MNTYPPYWVKQSFPTLTEIEEFEKVPLKDRGLPGNAYDFLRDGTAINPDAPAMHYFEDGDHHKDEFVTVSHRSLFARINQTANLLHSLGVGSTDVVTVLMPNIPETQYVLWGTEATGILNPINWMLDPESIAKLMIAASTKVLCAFGSHEDIDIWPKVEQVVSLVPSLEMVIRIGGGVASLQSSKMPVIDYAGVIDRFNSVSLDSGRQIESTDIAALFHTGGTTGAPKLAMQTHGAQVFTCWISGVVNEISDRDVRVCGVPMFHVTGVFSNCLTPFARGASVVIMTPLGWRHPSVLRNFWDIIQTFRVTGAGVVPTVVNQLINIPIGGIDISSLAYVGCGTAPLSVHIAQSFKDLTGIGLIEGFGMTETTAVSAMNPRRGVAKIGSIGMRLPYQAMKIIKIDSDGKYQSDCVPNQAGLLTISGPNVFPGYLGTESNSRTWVSDGWLNTGDLAYVDEDGYFWITGRVKDLIIRGGHNIDPKMVEECFYRHPAIAEVAVVGRPDAHAGEIPIVYITFKPGATCSIPRMKNFAYETIPERAGVPKSFFILERLPKTAIGKIKKNELRADAIRRAHQEVLQSISKLYAVDINVIDLTDSGLVSRIRVSGVNGVDQTHVRSEMTEALKPFTAKYQLEFA